jgi:hypothetical protein
MERISLREAARQTSRSITTLRRYIRNGRLAAHKRLGRFGPEYFVSPADLAAAGFEVAAAAAALPSPLPAQRALAAPRAAALAAEPTVPLTLFSELMMKHEQLLVQYGMMRAGGLRSIELRHEIEATRTKLDDARAELRRLRETRDEQAAGLKRELYRANLELEGRALEISALHEKVRALELVTRSRPPAPREAIEEQMRRVASQVREVDRLESRLAGRPDDPAPDH